MSFAENRGAKIYWGEQGQGEAVLLIMASAGLPICDIALARCWPHTTAPSLLIIEARAAAMFPRVRTRWQCSLRMPAQCLTPQGSNASTFLAFP
jgi:hypothetical protein